MGDRTLTRLNVVLVAQTGPFAQSLKQAQGVAEQFGEKLKHALVEPLIAIGAAFGAHAIIEKFDQAIERVDKLAKTADRLGITTQSLAGLQLAANETGVGAERLGGAMDRLSRITQEATQGSVEAQKAIHDLGLRYSDLAAMAPDQQIRAVADAMAKLGTTGERTTLAIKFFGRSGAELIPLLQHGSAAFDKATEEAERFGTAVSRADASKIEEVKEAMVRFGEAAAGRIDIIIAKIAPLASALINAWVDGGMSADRFGHRVDTVVAFLVRAGGWVANAWQGLRIVFEALEVGSMKVAKGFVDQADMAVRAAEWIGAKMSQAWDLAKAGATSLGDAVGVVWAAMKIPIAAFVQFAGEQFAAMVSTAADAAGAFDADLGAKLTATSGKIAAATGSAVVEAKKAFDGATVVATAAASDVVTATKALFSPVVTEGSKALQELSAAYDAQAQKLNDNLAQSLDEAPAADRFQALVDSSTAEADFKAEWRAKEIAAEQAQQNALAAANAKGFKAREDAQTGFYAITQSAGFKYTQQTVNGMSSMFSNLSTLQQSHDKRARALGKAAAKAKIVTDTAAAAMASYQALAGIPYVGPFLGAAAAAAAIAAGVVQLGNVDKSDSGTIGGSAPPPDTSTTNIGGVSAPSNGQTLILQGDSFSADSLVKLFDDAKERGYQIDGVRRG